MSTTWRDELADACKSQAEREAEEKARLQKRVEEALRVAEGALEQALDGLHFARDRLADKGQPATLDSEPGAASLRLRDLILAVSLDRETAIVKIRYNEARPREFDFAKDKHISPKDVEEYVGRRAIELVRTAQKQAAW